jgi:alkylation response protein AidB-like acyl-CoA dehydrogenase
MEPDYQQFEVELDGVELDGDAVVGGPAGIGAAFGLAGDWLPYGRIALAARAVGLGEWALGVARRYAAGRELGGGRLDDKQYVREMLVRSDVDLTASWLLVREAAAALDANRVAVRETAVAKLHATETACRVVDNAIQVLGGRGWLSEYGLERAYREARLFRIVDGASELLKETIFTLGENR